MEAISSLYMSLFTMQIVMVLLLINGASALKSSDCTNTLASLSSCLSYITGNATAPQINCCQQFSTEIQSNPRCLCLIINGGIDGLTISRSQALNLPGACNIQTPSFNLCNAYGYGSASGRDVPVLLLFVLFVAVAYISVPN